MKMFLVLEMSIFKIRFFFKYLQIPSESKVMKLVEWNTDGFLKRKGFTQLFILTFKVIKVLADVA